MNLHVQLSVLGSEGFMGWNDSPARSPASTAPTTVLRLKFFRGLQTKIEGVDQPEAWLESAVTRLFKKGDIEDCNNFTAAKPDTAST